MKSTDRQIKRGYGILFLFFMALALCVPAAEVGAVKKRATVPAKQEKNTFTTPDFAFPRTVGGNARVKYREAISSGNGLLALQAALQMDVAATQISGDSISEALENFRRIESMGEPYAGLARLVQADIYRQIYNADRPLYDSRRIPVSPRPSNVKEWSTPMFAQVVDSLVRASFSGSQKDLLTPVSAIAPMLTDTGDAERAGLTVMDFMTLKGAQILSTFSRDSGNEVIPFGTSGERAKLRPQSLTDELFDADLKTTAGNASRSSVMMFAKLNRLSGAEADEWLKDCLAEFGATRYGAPFVAASINAMQAVGSGIAAQNALRRRKYETAVGYINKFPDAPGIGELQSIRNSLEDTGVNVRFPIRALPGREIPVDVSGTNLFDFNLLVYKVPGNDFDRNATLSTLRKGCSLVAAIPVAIPGSTPDCFDTVARIPALPSGIYAVVASRTKDLSGLLSKLQERRSVSLMQVSDIATVELRDSRRDGMRLYVVKGENQEPVKGAKVSLYPMVSGKKGAPTILTTGSDGSVIVNSSRCYYQAEYEGNYAQGEFYGRGYGQNEEETLVSGNILTDLPVYRPGNSIQFAAIVYNNDDNRLSPASARKIESVLRDANYQVVDSLTFTTDSFGRASGKLRIPSGGLLGNYTLQLRDSGRDFAYASVEVAEYKAPSFIVDVKSAPGDHKPGDELLFNGSALTYSGMPVGDAAVSYKVDYQPLWWKFQAGAPASYTGSTRTAADGSFHISLPTAGIENTRFSNSRFILTATVTDNAGESQESDPLRFSIGKALHISANLPERVEVSEKRDTFNVAVYDLADLPVKRRVAYAFSSEGKELLSGEFDSPVFAPDLSALKSGSYNIRFSLVGEDSTSCEAMNDSVVLYRVSDVVPPVKGTLWVPKDTYISRNGEKVRVYAGSSFPDSYILAVVSDSKREIRREWIKVSDSIATLTLDPPAENERLKVAFSAMHDLDKVLQTVTVIPEEQKTRLDISADVFRDKITPGDQEKWKFRFSVKGVPQGDIPVFAVMTDKALNAIASFSWNLDPYSYLYWDNPVRLSSPEIYKTGFYDYIARNKKVAPYGAFETPGWQTYGYPLYPSQIFVRGTMRKMASRATAGAQYLDAAAPMASMNMVEMSADMAVEEAKEAAPTEAGGGSPDNLQLREVNMPLAFFKPSLSTDADGVAEIDFTVPDFVGTWQLQVCGYNRQMKGAVISLDAVASKKVMAQLNAPRFLRTGDKAVIAATLFNNSGRYALLSGTIEIFDLTDGHVLASGELGAENVEAAGSRVISTELSVPSGLSNAGVRVRARIPGFSDGEQTVVPILPADAPLVESTPFYIAPKSDTFEVKLPSFNSGASVTLTYCDNPVWECVTALPALNTPKSVNVLAQADALFGNCISSSLLRKYPALLKGIMSMAAPENAGDSLLVSPLEKNQDLKIRGLSETPWVNSAAAETARMKSLTAFADTMAAAGIVKGTLDNVLRLQNADGGWSWCPDMKSSAYITRRVLGRFATLRNLDAFPAEAQEAVKKAFAYCDEDLVSEWNLSADHSFSVTDLLDYLYEKSAFNGKIGDTHGFGALEKAAMAKIKADWRGFGIRDKALAATLLYRKGFATESREILASLGEYASYSQEKGMWFDNLSSGYSGVSPLVTTAKVLEAFSLVEPGDSRIDSMRQWLVVSKQVGDWGDALATAEVISALLSSGSDWTASGVAPVITIDGKPVDTSAATAVTGSLTVDIDPASASGKTLAVRKGSAGPAWGGVISQYVAPVSEVKAQSIPQLSVSKSVYALTDAKNGGVKAVTELAEGNRVRVTLTIVCDRDLDYVAVTDPRAACLEPVDQLSSYTSSDGVWYYREVRDDATNIFIPFLAKGTHVLNYECFVDRQGEYSLGVASVQSQYAPQITAHSAGAALSVAK